MTVSRLAAVLVALALVLGLPDLPDAGARQPIPVVTPHVTMAMAERFGIDLDGDGVMDMPNTSAYVHNAATCAGACPGPRFDVLMRAGVDGFDLAAMLGGQREIRWEIRGEALPQPLLYSTAYPELLAELPEGSYEVTVSTGIQLAGAILRVSTTDEITVQDLLVVAIGDSYASGEGNPEVRRQGGGDAHWGDSIDAEAASEHADAHRSSIAWPARLALTMERADASSSVTFVTVAETGATIERGVLGPQRTTSQIDQVRSLVGDREIDLLLIQVGGNDIGFAHAIQALVEADPLFDPICYDRLVDNVFASVADGDWGRGVSLGYEAPISIVCRPAESNRGWRALPGIDGLPGEFARLAQALEGLPIGEVALVGYPNPTGSDESGATCGEIVGDASPPFGFHEIDRHEQRLGVARILDPLNAALERAAAAHGWTYAAGVSEAFAAGHGYCAPWPDYGASTGPGGAGSGHPSLDDPDRWFRNPGILGGPTLIGGGPVTWYRTAAQSAKLQGPGTRFMTTGTLHPNEIGHDAIARLVLAALREARLTRGA